MAKATKSQIAKGVATHKSVVAQAKALSASKTAPAKAEAKPDPDAIKLYKKATQRADDPSLLVQSVGGAKVVFDRDRLTKQLNDLLAVGKSFAAVQEYLAKQKPAMAQGVNGRSAPHSAKAMEDARPVAAPKAAKASTTKTPRTASARADAAAPFAVLVQASASGLKPTSDRYARLLAVQNAKTIGEALSAKTADGKPVKMDNLKGMLERGHVKY